MYYTLSLCLLVLLCNNCAVRADMTLQDPRFVNRTLPTGQIYHKYLTSQFDAVSGQFVFNATNVEGKIVYLPGIAKTDFWAVLVELQNQGAIGVVLRAGSRVPGIAYCTYNGEDFLSEIVIPIVQVSRYDFDADIFPLLQQAEVLNITITGGGNLWYDTYNSPVFTGLFRAVLGALSAALVVYAAVVLAIFIRAQGNTFNIPQVCLGLELIANIFACPTNFGCKVRLVYVTADPFGCFFNLQSVTSNILESITLPLNVATFVLITFFWYEAITDASIRIYKFLSKLQIPFFALTFALVAIDFMFSFLEYYKGVKDTIPLLVIYLVIQSGFLIFYAITVIQIAKRMQKSAEISGGKKKVSYLLQINKRMILCGSAKLILIIYAIIWAALQSESVFDNPVVSATLWGILFLALMLDSFCRIYLFNVKQAFSTSSGSKKNPMSLTSKPSQSQLRTTASEVAPDSSEIAVETNM